VQNKLDVIGGLSDKIYLIKKDAERQPASIGTALGAVPGAAWVEASTEFRGPFGAPSNVPFAKTTNRAWGAAHFRILRYLPSTLCAIYTSLLPLPPLPPPKALAMQRRGTSKTDDGTQLRNPALSWHPHDTHSRPLLSSWHIPEANSILCRRCRQKADDCASMVVHVLLKNTNWW
jgi:hypothetical protein